MDEKMNTKTGTLYGIGVGPGDPELMTMKSVRILSRVHVIFTASSTKNDYSIAVNAATPYIPETTPVITLSFPMTKDKTATQKAWKSHADTIISHLEQGKDAAFLTLGDPMTYSTYGYILKNIQAAAPHLSIETVPGITSYQAAAARINTPLVEGEEALLITSGVKGGDRLREFADRAENIVLLKAYRNVKDISRALEECDMFENSTGITNCCLPDEEIIRDIKTLGDRPPGYWTLIIAKRKKIEN
jgi:precorrin-2/cobalt-factor-2 C20-methyltransferase